MIILCKNPNYKNKININILSRKDLSPLKIINRVPSSKLTVKFIEFHLDDLGLAKDQG